MNAENSNLSDYFIVLANRLFGIYNQYRTIYDFCQFQTDRLCMVCEVTQTPACFSGLEGGVAGQILFTITKTAGFSVMAVLSRGDFPGRAASGRAVVPGIAAVGRYPDFFLEVRKGKIP